MRVVVVSTFIADEGMWDIKKISLEKAKKVLEEAEEVNVYTQHQTVKLLGLKPDKERRVYSPNGEIQVWLKPKGRLEFGREYSIEELLEIGIVPYIAIPVE